jgi:hypothetical protein
VASQLGFSKGKIREIAENMTRKGFKAVKEEFGTRMSKSQDEKRIEIREISDAVSIPSADIVRGKLVVKK